MSALGIGLLCAVIASLPHILQGKIGFREPLLVLAVGAIASLVQRAYYARFPLRTSVYDGVVDLMIHIHSRYVQDHPLRWAWRSLISFLLCFSGGFVGIEGAATEISQTVALQTRSRSDRWSEQRRRTDVAVILAGGISAAFQAPFAAVVLCLELSTGGRTLSAVVSALSAYLGVLFLARRLDLDTNWVTFFRALPSGNFTWWMFPVIGVAVGAFGAGLIRFFHYFQESFVDLFRRYIWARAIFGSLLLVGIQYLYPASQEAPAVEYMSLLNFPREWPQLLTYLLSEVMVLAAILSAFGTVGIFTPLLTIGGVVGLALLSGLTGFLSGAAALWGGFLGAPLAGAILIFELTQSWEFLVAALIAALVADQTRKLLRLQPFFHRSLATRGLKLLDGRNVKILDTILVRDAMVTDHLVVYENELVKDLMTKFVASKHTFLPVVNRVEKYVGLLTLDAIQDGLENVDRAKGDFFEVKDLLYKINVKPKTVTENESLSCTAGLFTENSCVAVTSEGGVVVGLLFAYSVRAAYDREVARRALVRQSEGMIL